MSNISAILALSLLATTLHAQPECLTGDSLHVRNAHGMAYDAVGEQVLLFGGADEDGVLGDLWAFDGSTWNCLASEGPPARTFPATAYRDSAGQLHIFGGNRVLFGDGTDENTYLDDHWVWDGMWRPFEGMTPSARAEASMAYDPVRDRLVLYGGYRIEQGETLRLTDTWEWDGQQWRRVSTDGPRAGNGTAMVYDPAREHVLLWGGSGASGETWARKAIEWRLLNSNDEIGRFNSAMMYDAKLGTVVRFGGWDGEKRTSGTWIWTRDGWQKLTSEGPSARNHTQLVFDSEHGYGLLFGGHDGPNVLGETWIWRDSTWIRIIDENPRPRAANEH